MTQGYLAFQYESDRASEGVTGLAGLPVYWELAQAMGLVGSIERHVKIAGPQGWDDAQQVLALVALNLAGGEGLEDLDRLESDAGFGQLVRALERHGLGRAERRAEKRRWRGERRRAVPSAAAAGRWLEKFHRPEEEARREPGRAFIPAPGAGLEGLSRVNAEVLAFAQANRPVATATLDMDATLVATHKRQALYCYKHHKAYQPLNTWWAEHGLVVHSEFRDGNVPAGYEQLRVLRTASALLPAGVRKLYLRSDTAAYQQEVLTYCAEGRDERFGVIEFAISADVTAAFRQAVVAVSEADWRPLERIEAGQRLATDQQWAEVCYVPNWAGYSKQAPDYRFLAIREPLRQLELGDAAQLPFPTALFGSGQRYKLFGVVTNRTLPGDDVIRWQRERCGKSEEAHAVMKDDLAGGRLPSGLFGANAAWWAIMILAHNLNAVMKQLVLGGAWARRRLKALRFGLIALAGRVVRHARRLVVRVADSHLALLHDARVAIRALLPAPSG